MLLGYLLRYGSWHGPAESSALVFVAKLMTSLLLWCACRPGPGSMASARDGHFLWCSRSYWPL